MEKYKNLLHFLAVLKLYLQQTTLEITLPPTRKRKVVVGSSPVTDHDSWQYYTEDRSFVLVFPRDNYEVKCPPINN